MEGDSLNVIMALSGVMEAEDWRARGAVETGKRLLGITYLNFRVLYPELGILLFTF